RELRARSAGGVALSEHDWLDGPAPAQALQPRVEAARQEVVAKARNLKRPKALIEAERKLKPMQRLYMWALIESETVIAANNKIRALAGKKINASTFQAWRKKPAFIHAMEHAQEYALRCIGI